MGLRAKTQKRAQRLAKKRADKAAMKAQYEGYRDAGKNSKRAAIKAKKGVKLAKNFKHNVSFCGNFGCNRCFNRVKPQYAKAA